MAAGTGLHTLIRARLFLGSGDRLRGRPMTADQRRQLDEQGWVVLEDAMGPDLLRALRDRILTLFDEEGEPAGSEFKTEEHARRLANLVDKGEVFRQTIVLPQVLSLVRHVLGPDMKLSSLNARSADPQTDIGQPLHVDMGALPDEAAIGSAIRSGCSTTSPPRTVPRASCRVPTDGETASRRAGGSARRRIRPKSTSPATPAASS